MPSSELRPRQLTYPSHGAHVKSDNDAMQGALVYDISTHGAIRMARAKDLKGASLFTLLFPVPA